MMQYLFLRRINGNECAVDSHANPNRLLRIDVNVDSITLTASNIARERCAAQRQATSTLTAVTYSAAARDSKMSVFHVKLTSFPTVFCAIDMIIT